MLNTLLDRFKHGLDRSGIAIPTALPEKPEGRVNYEHEPHPQLWPLMALAQHHGLPTILLDWSTRAYVAAYFAARDATDPGTKDRGAYLAVWALRIGYAEDPTRGGRTGHPIYEYAAPGGTNPNLRAQSGTFTVLREGAEEPSHVAGLGGDVASLPLEEFVSKELARDPSVVDLVRLTLPSTEAGRLLRLLSYEGVDSSTMFPGADGVARAMREVRVWDRRGGA